MLEQTKSKRRKLYSHNFPIFQLSRFIYTDSANVTPANATALIVLANQYGMSVAVTVIPSLSLLFDCCQSLMLIFVTLLIDIYYISNRAGAIGGNVRECHCAQLR